MGQARGDRARTEGTKSEPELRTMEVVTGLSCTPGHEGSAPEQLSLAG